MKASVRRWFNFNVMLRFCNNFLKLEVSLMFLLYYYFIHTYIHTYTLIYDNVRIFHVLMFDEFESQISKWVKCSSFLLLKTENQKIFEAI